MKVTSTIYFTDTDTVEKPIYVMKKCAYCNILGQLKGMC